MGKRTASANAATESGISPRQPCPCGSGKRYKACHGAKGGASNVIVTRPFEGLAAERELIAMREFLPSATAKLPLISGPEVTIVTVLPMAAAALKRSDGRAFVALQVHAKSGDASRDLARAIEWVQEAADGTSLSAVGPETTDPAAPGQRLQDVLDPEAKLEVEVHQDFSWWLPEDTETTEEVKLSLERANAAIMPTERLVGLESAYWSDAGEKAYLRWVRPESEERLLAALARLSARGELALDEDSRYAGSFRAHGLLVPVWDLDREKHVREWEEPAAALGQRLEEALASLDNTPLDAAERRAREGLRGRQITVR